MNIPVKTNLFSNRSTQSHHYPHNTIVTTENVILFTVDENDFRNHEYKRIKFFDAKNKSNSIHLHAQNFNQNCPKKLTFADSNTFEKYLLSGDTKDTRDSGLIFQPRFEVDLSFNVVGKSGIDVLVLNLLRVAIDDAYQTGTIYASSKKGNTTHKIPFIPITELKKEVMEIQLYPEFQIIP